MYKKTINILLDNGRVGVKAQSKSSSSFLTISFFIHPSDRQSKQRLGGSRSPRPELRPGSPGHIGAALELAGQAVKTSFHPPVRQKEIYTTGKDKSSILDVKHCQDFQGSCPAPACLALISVEEYKPIPSGGASGCLR